MSPSGSPPHQSIDLDEFERRLREPQSSAPQPDALSELARLVGEPGRDPFAPIFGEKVPPRQAAAPAPAAPSPAPAAAPAQTWSPQGFSDRLSGAFEQGYNDFSKEPVLKAPAPKGPVLRDPPREAVARPNDFFAERNPISTGYPRAPSIHVNQTDYAPEANYMAEAPQAAYAPQAGYAPQGGFYAQPPAEPEYDPFVGAPADPAAAQGQYNEPWLPEDHYAPPPADFGYDEPKSSRRRVYVTAGILLLIAGGIGGAFTLRSMSGPKEAPVIKALAGPTKVEPENPGGPIETNTSATVLSKGGESVTDTKVVNREEQPVDLSQAPLRQQRLVGAGAPATAPNNGFPEPRRVKTVSVRPDGSIIEGSESDKPVVPTPAPPAAQPAPLARPSLMSLTPTTNKPAAPAVVPAAPVADPKAATPKTVTRGAATPQASAPEEPRRILPASVAASKPATPTAIAAVATSGTFAVQLSGSPSEAEAKTAASTLQAKYAGALGGHRPSVMKGDVGGRTVYRVRVNVADRTEAISICERIKASGGTCFIAAN